MRDTDRDLRSVIVVRADSPAQSPADLRGPDRRRRSDRFAAGHPAAAVAAPAARAWAWSGRHRSRRFDVGVGLHGDHIGGEREAAPRAARGEVDAACMIDSNLLLFSQEGTLPPGSVRVIGQTEPYDHCNMTAGPGADAAPVDRFAELLLSMSYADPVVRPLLDLEGSEAVVPGRLEGYAAARAGGRRSRFYDGEGRHQCSRLSTLSGLGLDAGGHLLIERALAGLTPGDRLTVTGRHPALAFHLGAWCRAQGHRLESRRRRLIVVQGTADRDRAGPAPCGPAIAPAASRAGRPPLGAGRAGRAGRGRRPAAGGRLGRPRLGVGRRRPAAVRERGRAPVGSGDGGRLVGARRRCPPTSRTRSCRS